MRDSEGIFKFADNDLGESHSTENMFALDITQRYLHTRYEWKTQILKVIFNFFNIAYKAT